jgi:hypothetical protein
MVHRKGMWISTDAWRGYWKPANSIIGQSVFGEKPDRERQDQELKQVKDFLKRMKIPYRVRSTRSSNVFMAKRWIIIPSHYKLTKLQEDFVKEFAKKETKTFHE